MTVYLLVWFFQCVRYGFHDIICNIFLAGFIEVNKVGKHAFINFRLFFPKFSVSFFTAREMNPEQIDDSLLDFKLGQPVDNGIQSDGKVIPGHEAGP